MSSAKNHAKRSHRSNFRARAWNGGRRSVIKPTAKKFSFFQWIKMIRDARNRKKESKNDTV